MTTYSYFVLALLLMPLMGCIEEPNSQSLSASDNDVVICTTEYVYGINIEVYDQQSSEPIACGATLTLQDGDFLETITLEDNTHCMNTGSLTGAGERAGNYHITVSKEGYNLWQQDNVEVSRNRCHVNPVTLKAYL